MDEPALRRQLADLIAGTDPGTLLLLLSEVLDERAEEARQAGDAGRHEQLQFVAHAAYVLGLGTYSVLTPTRSEIAMRLTAPDAKFDPGHVVATPGARDALHASGEPPARFLRRHMVGDWGDVGEADKLANDLAVQDGGRIMSAYTTRSAVKLWVITEAVGDDGKRGSTCLLLPDEY